MNINSSKKSPVQKPSENKYKKSTPVNWKLYEFCVDMEIPHGKYQGLTVGYVLENEKWYRDWLEQVAGDWGLIQLRGTVTAKKKPTGVYSQKYGGYLIGIREI